MNRHILLFIEREVASTFIELRLERLLVLADQVLEHDHGLLNLLLAVDNVVTSADVDRALEGE